MTNVQEERTVFAFFHELERGLGKFVIGIRDAVWIFVANWWVLFLAERILFVVGCRKIRRAITHPSMESSSLVHKIKTITFRCEPGMPFPYVAGTIAVLLHRVGDREDIEIQMRLQIRSNQSIGVASRFRGSEINMCQLDLGGMLPRDDARARR